MDFRTFIMAPRFPSWEGSSVAMGIALRLTVT
jgi:hypothetical protein